MTPQGWMRRGGWIVLACVGAAGVLLVAANRLDQMQWRALASGEAAWESAYHTTRAVRTCGWVAAFGAIVASGVVMVYGMRHWRGLDRAGRRIAMACAVLPVLALVAGGLFLLLFIAFRSGDFRYG